MPGSSVAAPSAAGWVTDFLNAAYFARPRGWRDVRDLRLAFGVLTTLWAQRGGRRLGAGELVAFHRAFGLRRLRARPRGTLDRAALLAGGSALVGDWFAEAWPDPARRAHGIAFPTPAEREAFDPALRLATGNLRALTPPRQPPEGQHWGTYPPVALPDAEAAVALLLDPARWPDMGSAGGRFTAVRRGALEDATFEIEVATRPVEVVPVYTRAYVSCTAVHGEGDPELAAYVEGVDAALRAHGEDGAVPKGARPLLAVELTTHEGHFLGRAVSRLIAFADERGSWVRDVGSWDPLPWHLAQAYAVAGERAQAAFWGPEPAEDSMLAQLGQVTARP